MALSTVIEGESLMNDGSAMVLFSIFYKIGFHGESATWASGLVTFCKLALGGLGVGTAAFLCLHTWLRWFTHEWLESLLVIFLITWCVRRGG